MTYVCLAVCLTLLAPEERGASAKPRAVLWCDATANLPRIQSRETIAKTLDKCVAAGIDAVIFDVKPVSGEVLYDSTIAERLREWKGVAAPLDFDPLAVAVEEARVRGLRIYASVNVLSEGHKHVRRGLAYAVPELQCVAYDVERRLEFPDGVFPIAGSDRKPGECEITITSSRQSETSPTIPGQLIIAVDSDGIVTDVLDGEMGPGEISIPREGYVLAAGAGLRDVLIERVRPGVPLNLQGDPKLVPIADAETERIACFVNPILLRVRERELAIIREIAEKYDTDGIVLDRLRYSGYAADFSDASRAAFESRLGRHIDRFPQDILTMSPIPGVMQPGPLYPQWATWRARNIKEFLAEARKVIKTASTRERVCVYVGAWYDEYDAVGVNWAREGFPPASEWLTAEYAETGYADLCDIIFAGCYFRPISVEDDPSGDVDPLHTVGGAARRAVEVVGDAAQVVGGVYLDMYAGDPEQMKRAVRECLRVTGSVMLFDLVHLEMYDWWDAVRAALMEAD